MQNKVDKIIDALVKSKCIRFQKDLERAKEVVNSVLEEQDSYSTKRIVTDRLPKKIKDCNCVGMRDKVSCGFQCYNI